MHIGKALLLMSGSLRLIWRFRLRSGLILLSALLGVGGCDFRDQLRSRRANESPEPDSTVRRTCGWSHAAVEAASVSPSTLTNSGTLTVTGITQTNSGYSGQLFIQATGCNGTLDGTSPGFSVAPIPWPFKTDLEMGS